MSDDRPLTDEEAAAVFRRATELDVELAHRSEGWDLGQLEAVGREVGISAEAVRRAAAEVRLGPVPFDLGDHVVRCWRIVPVTAEQAQATLAAWLREQLFEPVRDRPGVAVFDARRDAEAERRRHRDQAGRLRLLAVSRVALAAGAVPGGGSAVRVEAALAESRRRHAFGRAAAAVPISGVTASVVAAATPLGIVWLGVPAVGAAGWWAWRRSAFDVRSAAAEVVLAVDGALDRLERQNPR